MRNQYPKISGSSGKVVRCHPDAQPQYNALESLALSGNHWARSAINSIKSLSRGHSTHLDASFQPTVKSKNPVVDVSLPGGNALLERCSDDSYVLMSLTFLSGVSRLALSTAYNAEASDRDRARSAAAAHASKNKLRMHFERFDGKKGTSGKLYIYKGVEAIYSGVAYNAPTNPGDEPFGTNGQLANGAYKVMRRQCGACRYKDHPAISNVGIPGNVKTPSGRVRSGIVMHRGYGPHHSQGCIVSPDMYDDDGPISTLMQFDEYENGKSIPLHITYQDG